MKVSSMITLVSLLLLLVSSSFPRAEAQDFSWTDCGVPGVRNIHYNSVTISPYPARADTNGSLSINVEATIVNMIYEADTELQIWQEGAQFLSVQIAPLCDIIGTTNALSCPIPVGKISFTYTFQDIPEIPMGDYMAKIVSSVSGVELGCLQLGGQIEGAYTSSSCHYQSYANADLSANFLWSQSSAAQRYVGSTFQIVGSAQGSNYASFTSYQSSPDLSTSTSVNSYALSGYGVVTSHSTSGNIVYESYEGNFTISYLLSANNYQTVYTGEFLWDGVTNPDNNPQLSVTGNMTLSPQYVYFYNTPLASVFTYPLTLGNLNPFTFKANGAGFSLSGSHDWCTCDVDGCGVCGGDGSSCGLGATHHGRSGKEIAAIVIGTVGGVFGIALVVVLARAAKRARSAPLLNDTDLIDHPDKPDYGTMAIDEAIREGERV